MFGDVVPHILALLALAVALAASGHAVLYKRDARSAIGWVALIWLVPLMGAVFYVSLGVNRIKRRAERLRGEHEERRALRADEVPTGADVVERLGVPRMASLVTLGDHIVHHKLTAGNRIELLVNGDRVFPAMLEAIDGAERSLSLATYIFDSDPAGMRFVEALEGAVRRGVSVRVLVDAVGARYSRHSIYQILRRSGVPVQRFLPTTVPWRFRYMNLRNHRKIMVVDGRQGFTGGINLREGNLLERQPPPASPIRDVHARIEGPVVAHLQQAFAEDWAFAGGERLEGERWFPALSPAGEVIARGIPDGPDEDFETIRIASLGALACAEQRVALVTPYFLPDNALITALNVAAMRGVQVDIVLPSRSNMRLVQWACMAMLWQVLRRGCRVWLSPPPFDHSKLMVVDGVWTMLGSANWDARSMRLNFEFNVECYARELAASVEALVDGLIGRSRRLTLADVDGRPLPIRLRDGVARLLQPFL